MHVEASRHSAHVYPVGEFPNPVARLIDEERRDAFTAEALHFESQCFITFSYLPPAEGMARLGDLFIERPGNGSGKRVSYQAHFDHFLGQVDQITNLMASFMPEVHELDDAETLTYLHSCVSDRRLNVAVPDVPFYLDEMITDRPLIGGLSPRLGRLFLKTVSVRAYVNRTLPCLLDRLNELPIEYRWVGRFMPMDKANATAHMNKLRRQWFAKRKGMMTLLKEAITKQESKLEDSDSLNKAQDVDDALQELGGDHCSFGDFTLTASDGRDFTPGVPHHDDPPAERGSSSRAGDGSGSLQGVLQAELRRRCFRRRPAPRNGPPFHGVGSGVSELQGRFPLAAARFAAFDGGNTNSGGNRKMISVTATYHHFRRPPIPRQFWLEPLTLFLRSHLGQSPFRRVWVFDYGDGRIDLTHP